MNKKIVSLLLGIVIGAVALAGCGNQSDSSQTSGASGALSAGSSSSSDSSGNSSGTESSANSTSSGDQDISGMTFAIVPKSAGNPYNESMASGFKEVIEGLGGNVIVSYPESATADAQITAIQSLISQNVDVIALSANDPNALSATLKQAMDEGIKVITLDSDVSADSRITYCNAASSEGIARALMDAVCDMADGEGEFAIVAASSQATNQITWINAMKNLMETDDKYANLDLVEVAYGDDEPQKSTEQTQTLLTKYPNLKVICSPTTVGISAAANVLQDTNSSVKLTGLGLPSEMASYIGDDGEHPCPYMYLWNTVDLGRLAAYTSIALVTGEITGEAGDTFEAGNMENSPYTVTEMEDGSGTEVVLGDPFQFTPDNIDEWKDVL